MIPNRFAKPLPALLVIFVCSAFLSTPAIAEKQSCPCQITNDSTLFAWRQMHLFGDLKVKMGAANDEYDHVEVDLEAPGYVERRVAISRNEPVTRLICGNKIKLSIKPGGIGVLTVSGAKTKPNDGWARLFLASQNGGGKDVELLLAGGANVNAKTKYGTTALMGVSIFAGTDIVKLLLDRGADVNARMFDGWTPLFLAAYNGRDDVVKLLLDRGADIDARAHNGDTALTVASKNQQETIVKLLLSRGADNKAGKNQGKTASFSPSKPGDRHCKIINDSALIIEHRVHLFGDLKVKMGLADFDEFSEVEVDLQAPGFEERGAVIRRKKPETREICGNKITFSLSAGGFLIVSGADMVQNDGWAALFLAAQNGRRKEVESLLSRGADVNAKTKYGTTVLMGASQNGHSDIVKLLLARKAVVNARSNNGDTALSLASQNGHEEVRRMLIKAGAK